MSIARGACAVSSVSFILLFNDWMPLLTIANAIPIKAPTLRTTGFQSAPKPLPDLDAGLGP